MKISVVTVCLNSERTIGRTIESFLAQSWPGKELIVIDGASRDRTRDIVQSFDAPLIHLHSAPDRGLYDAMNKGLRLYSGDAVGFLNSDDSFHDPYVLELLAAALQDAEAAYGDLVFLKHGADAARRVRTWKAGPYRKGSFRAGWMPPHPTFYIRRSLAERVGEFAPRFGSAADYDFMLRALEIANPRVAYVPRTLVDFAQGGTSTSGWESYVRGNLLCLKSRRERLNAGAVDLALLLKPLRKIHQFRWSS